MIDSSIVVTVAASDRSLLTIDQLRAAVGVSDGSQDAALETLGARVSAAFAKTCGIARDGDTPPTFLKETITQTTRLDGVHYRNLFSDERPLRKLILLRRPVISVASVTIDGELQDPSTYEIRKGSGFLIRLNSDDLEIPWCGRKIVTIFDAGYSAVPDDLSLIAAQFAQILWWQDGKDPNQKMDWTDGISRSEWFANPHDGDLVPPALIGALEAGGFVNPSMG